MQFNELTILYFQVAAALLMGWDYFTPTSWREHMNGMLAQYFGQVQGRIDHDLAGAWAYIKVSATRIFAALVSFGLAYAVLKVGGVLGHSQPYVVLVTNLVSFSFFAAGALTLINIVTPLLIPIGLGCVFRLFTTFLTSTEKGPMSGIGFLSLLVSFVMQYMNYKTT
jgi:hypothetical protein